MTYSRKTSHHTRLDSRFDMISNVLFFSSEECLLEQQEEEENHFPIRLMINVFLSLLPFNTSKTHTHTRIYTHLKIHLIIVVD